MGVRVQLLREVIHRCREVLDDLEGWPYRDASRMRLRPRARRRSRPAAAPETGPGDQGEKWKAQPETITGRLAADLRTMEGHLGGSDDIVFREMRIGSGLRHQAALIYTDGLADKTMVQEHLMRSIMLELRMTYPNCRLHPAQAFGVIRDAALTMAEIRETRQVEELVVAVLSGETVFLLDGYAGGLILSTRGWPKRSLEEPATEAVIRGSREGFIETLRSNTALVRRRIRDPHLKVRTLKVGRRTKTDVAVLYIDGVVNPRLVEEVHRRLKDIDIDGILESGYIEQLVEENPMSPFPTMIVTERPDEVAAGLLEGRVSILVDNTPFALIVPGTFDSFFKSGEDHYERWIISSSIRLVRFVGSLIAILLPSLYVAVTSFHPGLLSSKLALTVAASREGVPFPAVVEATIMELTFELFREAGIRLPGALGQTIGIVGGIVIGQVAVSAGIASQTMMLILAFTAISSFALPSFNVAVGFRLLRFPLMFSAAVFGLYGLVMAALAILVHLSTLRSFGTWYLAPYAGYRVEDFKDTLIRAPLRSFVTRPSFVKPSDRRRLGGDRSGGEGERKA